MKARTGRWWDLAANIAVIHLVVWWSGDPPSVIDNIGLVSWITITAIEFARDFGGK